MALAAARLSFSGIHRAKFFGVEPTGREIRWAGAAFFTMAGGQITELWVLGDIDAVRQHTGQPVKRIQDDTERDYIMSADQGKEYGIIDDVIRKRA